MAAIESIKPTTIIGVSTVGGTFTQEVIEAMSQINERPVVLALSNPTEHAECTPEQAYTWSKGKAIYAAGVQFPPVHLSGQASNRDLSGPTVTTLRWCSGQNARSASFRNERSASPEPPTGEHLLCKDNNSFQAFHVLLTFLLFPTNWGICFSFKANSNGLNLTHKCTVRAR